MCNVEKEEKKEKPLLIIQNKNINFCMITRRFFVLGFLASALIAAKLFFSSLMLWLNKLECFYFFASKTCGLCYKHNMTIEGDTCLSDGTLARVVNYAPIVKLEIVVSLTDHSRSLNYNHFMFIAQITEAYP